MRLAVSKTRNLWRTGVVAVVSLLVGGTAVVLSATPAMALTPTTSAIPIPGLVANCPPPSNSVGQGGPAPVGGGVTATGASGECTLTQAHAAVGRATFGANVILSADSRCTVNGVPFSSAYYKGATITATTTIVTPDGYTLNFNVPVIVGSQAGRIAVQIISPSGAIVNLAETLCAGASYPLRAQLNTEQARGLSPISAGGHSGTSSALLLLVGALTAFLAVNLTVVRRYRQRHNGTAG